MKAPPEHIRCETCRYIFVESDGYVTCRRRAPLPTGTDIRVSVWPRTRTIEWCGEWQSEHDPWVGP